MKFQKYEINNIVQKYRTAACTNPSCVNLIAVQENEMVYKANDNLIFMQNEVPCRDNTSSTSDPG